MTGNDCCPPLIASQYPAVFTGRDVAAVAAMLLHAKPKRVDVDMEAADLRGAPWGALVAAAGGVDVVLKLSSPDRNEHHDDLLLPLQDSGVRLVTFSGCVGTSAGVAALASCVARDADLYINMAAPLDLSALGGTYKYLCICVSRPFPPPGPSSPTWPLPSSPPPTLAVELADVGSWEAGAHTILSLAPPGKRFGSLRCSRGAAALDRCSLRAAVLVSLLQRLHAAGVRTETEGDTCAEVDEWGTVRLWITDQWPTGGPEVLSDAELRWRKYLGWRKFLD
ncbi:uncharacterized protein LOC125178893 [Hyalella azteca]|uniref:Uncharacterized protein LOC125178893 n=1 Tax=Hyalella azteca TaxID=294128 RepID=A0A979FRA9_HYAAZ|nr:uncharacterized protein LOC125178893 [Hyalella azteca]